MKKLLLIGLLLNAIFSLGQNEQEEMIAEVDFLQLDSNQLRFFGDSSAMMKFYQKLDTAIYSGEGKLNIYQMGGSHVQAGVLSNAIREHFYTLFPGLYAERGFLFPMRLAQSNNPRNFSVNYKGIWEGARASVPWHEGRWGLSAAIATTKEVNSQFEITAYSGDTGVFSFTTLRLFHLMDSSQFFPVLESLDTNVTITYDSIANLTEYHFSFPQTTAGFHFEKKNKSQNQFVLQGIQFISHESGLVYHAIGVNGASVPSFLRCEDLPSQMALIPPDLVIFGIGINDAYKSEKQFIPEEYEANYDSLIAIIHSINPDCAFIFMSNNDSYYKRQYPNPNVYRAREVQKRLAKKYNSAFWDLFAIMGGFNSIAKWEKMNWAPSDKIHFKRKGYELQAYLLFKAIKKSYLEYQKANYRATIH